MHLERWADRNEGQAGLTPSPELGSTSPSRDKVNSITRWAYDRAFELSLPTWIKGREVQMLSPHYTRLLRT